MHWGKAVQMACMLTGYKFSSKQHAANVPVPGKVSIVVVYECILAL
jgi:hypothetical protein